MKVIALTNKPIYKIEGADEVYQRNLTIDINENEEIIIYNADIMNYEDIIKEKRSVEYYYNGKLQGIVINKNKTLLKVHRIINNKKKLVNLAISKSNSNIFTDEINKETFKVKHYAAAGLATFSKRVEHVNDTIKSIINQVDVLYVYINDMDYVPKHLIKDKKIIYILGVKTKGDLGDIGKFYGSLIDKEYDFYFTLDDDIIYPKNYVETYLSKFELYGKECIITSHGRNFFNDKIKSYYNDKHTKVMFNGNNNKDIVVQFPGTGVSCYHRDTIRTINPDNFISKNMTDVYVGVGANINKIPAICIEHKANWLVSNDVNVIDPIYKKYKVKDNKQTTLVNSVKKYERFENLDTLRNKKRVTVSKKKYDFVINITTYNRNENLNVIIEQLNTQNTKHSFVINVLDDNPDNRIMFKYTNVRYYRNSINKGKVRYWENINKLWEMTQKFDFKYCINLDDDVILTSSFLDKTYDLINGTKYDFMKLMFVRDDKYPNNWGFTDWIDGCNLITNRGMRVLKFKVKMIKRSRFRKGLHVSTGVWSQITTRLNEARMKEYKDFSKHKSLMYHIYYNTNSVMNPETRKTQNLHTRFYDEDLEKEIRKFSSILNLGLN